MAKGSFLHQYKLEISIIMRGLVDVMLAPAMILQTFFILINPLTVLTLVAGLFLVLVSDVSLHCSPVYNLAAVWTGVMGRRNIF